MKKLKTINFSDIPFATFLRRNTRHQEAQRRPKALATLR
jgi:hypothetical protein